LKPQSNLKENETTTTSWQMEQFLFTFDFCKQTLVCSTDILYYLKLSEHVLSWLKTQNSPLRKSNKIIESCILKVRCHLLQHKRLSAIFSHMQKNGLLCGKNGKSLFFNFLVFLFIFAYFFLPSHCFFQMNEIKSC